MRLENVDGQRMRGRGNDVRNSELEGCAERVDDSDWMSGEMSEGNLHRGRDDEITLKMKRGRVYPGEGTVSLFRRRFLRSERTK